MDSQVSIAILLLTRFVFMGEEGVYNISINTMKEMEKRGWIGFLKAKRSLFSYARIGFS